MTLAPPCSPTPGRDHRTLRHPPLLGMTVPASGSLANHEKNSSCSSSDQMAAASATRVGVSRIVSTLGVCVKDVSAAWEVLRCLPRGLTGELNGRQRQDAKPGPVKMYRVPPPGLGGLPLVLKLSEGLGRARCETGLKSTTDFRPVVVDDAEANGSPLATVWHDALVANDALLDGSESKNCSSRPFVEDVSC